VTDVCAEYRIPLVHLSTVKVRPGDDGLFTPLGLSKLAGEHRILYRAHTDGLPYVILRPGTIYGPGQQGSPDMGWVTWFIRASLEEKEIEITGDGGQSRDVLYIGDFIGLLVDCVHSFDSYCGFSYDVGGGPENIVTPKRLLSHLAYDRFRYVESLPGDLYYGLSGHEQIQRVNGWVPTTDWRSGVKYTREYLIGELNRRTP
jgi:CDP-paratose 2-epimerase